MRKKIVIISIVIVVLIAAGCFFLSTRYVPPILMYHSVDMFKDITKLSVSPETFSRQMAFLYRHKYNVISFEEMVKLIKNKERIPPKTVTITFDDGYINNYTEAYPILKKYNFPATIFMITSMIGKPAYLSWEHLKELKENGIAIESHTISHRWMPDLSDADLKKEVYESKKILEKGLKKKVNFISYPVGAYDKRVQSCVKQAGYKGACGTNPGPTKKWDDIYALKRLRISRTSKSMLVFTIETSGYYTFIKEVRDDD